MGVKSVVIHASMGKTPARDETPAPARPDSPAWDGARRAREELDPGTTVTQATASIPHRRGTGRALLLASCCLLAVAVAGCGQPGPVAAPAEPEVAGEELDAPAPDPTRTVDRPRVVSDLPLSGSARAQALTMVQAIDMAFEQAGRRVGGRPIDYESMDGSSQAGEWDEETCIENITRAVEDPSVVAVIGPFNSGCARVQVPVANEAGLAMVSPATTAVGLTRASGIPGEPDRYYPSGVRTFLRVAVTDDVQARGAVAWARGPLGHETAYVIHDREAYGRGLAAQFRTAAAAAGLRVVGFESIDRSARNQRELATRVRESGADLLYFAGVFGNGAGQLVRDVRRSGSEVAIMGPDGIFDDAFIEAAGDAADGVHATFGGVPPEKLTGTGQAFIREFSERHGPPSAYTAAAYDAARVVLRAVTACADDGAVSRACVAEELFAIRDFDGAIGTFSFTDTGDVDLARLSGFQVRAGQWAFVRTLDADV